MILLISYSYYYCRNNDISIIKELKSYFAKIVKKDAQKPSIIKIGGAFQLKNQDGKIIKSSDFKGTFTLVYFGFSHCKKTCPVALHNIDSVIKDLKSNKVVPIFISLDPKRDTISRLKEYSEQFESNIQMLTGSENQISQIAKDYKTYYRAETQEETYKRTKNRNNKNYDVDHSSYIYLMGKNGQFITVFNYDENAEKMLKDIRSRL